MDKPLSQFLHEDLLKTGVDLVPDKGRLLGYLAREADRQFVKACRLLFFAAYLMTAVPNIDLAIKDGKSIFESPFLLSPVWMMLLFAIPVFLPASSGKLVLLIASLPIPKRFQRAAMFRSFAYLSFVLTGAYLVLIVLRESGAWSALNRPDSTPYIPYGLIVTLGSALCMACVIYVGGRWLARRLDPYWFA